jgi:hypothetical protein
LVLINTKLEAVVKSEKFLTGLGNSLYDAYEEFEPLSNSFKGMLQARFFSLSSTKISHLRDRIPDYCENLKGYSYNELKSISSLDYLKNYHVNYMNSFKDMNSSKEFVDDFDKLTSIFLFIVERQNVSVIDKQIILRFYVNFLNYKLSLYRHRYFFTSY